MRASFRYHLWPFLLALPAIVIASSPTHACGGFFCQTTPVNQAAERILFVADEGTVTTHVQIVYNGAAADFAWILPVPSVPELDVSHNEIFNQLDVATQPTFLLNWQTNEDTERCDDHIEWMMGGCPVCAVADGGPSVNVLSQRQVGPYDTSVIASEDAGAVTAWLQENEYALDALGEDLLRPYVEEGFYFLVLRLAAERDTGDLQPIALSYAADEPGIPLRLTAVAAEPDMGVLVWVLGPHRAIPRNYLHVHINEARIDWLLGGPNYAEVVTEAANEAGGQAFATDYAGPSDILDNRFYREGRFDLEALRLTEDPADFLDLAIRQGFPADAQMRALLRRHIPIPESVLDEGFREVAFDGNAERYEAAIEEGWIDDWGEVVFYNDLRAYRKYTAEADYDLVAFADDLEAIVVEPLRAAQHLFADKPYLTRLYTTLSAEEMSVDPAFSFNPELPDVSNIHRADARTVCSDSGELEETSALITLADGRELLAQPFSGADQAWQTASPAAFLIEQLNSSGPPVVIRRATAVEEEPADVALPSAHALLPNYPNPFNSSTILPFHLPSSASTVSLRIYDLLGQPVRTLLQGALRPGYYEAVWDGRDQNGNSVASGAYFSRLETGETRLTRKLLLLR